VAFAQADCDVIAVDVDARKTDAIAAGDSYIEDVSSEELREVSSRIHASTRYARLAKAEAVLVCVPTPLTPNREPDLGPLLDCVRALAEVLQTDQLVVLESTTYPGTTRERVAPLLEESGLAAGRDFNLAFSPERVDPGNRTYTTRNIPKIVGGHGPASTEAAAALYGAIVSKVIPVSSTRVAEMVKLLENTFRAVNIGLVNEIAQMCHKLDIDVWEVIEAAKTKPFGFMPFYPGPGLGGHCIPIDPFYLSWKARQSGFECRFIELAGQVNGSMPEFVVDRVVDALNDTRKPVNGSRIHLYGVAYKRDVSDMRESPALDIIELLTRRGAVISYSDPYVPTLKEGSHYFEAVDEAEALRRRPDCVVICTDHGSFEWKPLVESGIPIVDTRNALRSFAAPNIVRLSGRAAPTPAPV